MPRRIYTYEAGHGWEIWNQLTTLGAIVQVPSFAILVYNLTVSLWKGKRAGDNPWEAWTLEWAATSPPPAYNFETLPTVHSRRPLWDLKHPDDPDWNYE
jgi:cytochrome c oxidase subunit 1